MEEKAGKGVGSPGYSGDPNVGSGAGNPAGAARDSDKFPQLIGQNGTGGLVIIYCNLAKGTGKVTSEGSNGGNGKSGRRFIRRRFY